jgi:uncharacterized protein YaaR (DUF327 family)
MAKISDLVSPLLNPALQGWAGEEARKTSLKQADKKGLRKARAPEFSSVLQKAQAAAEGEEPLELPESPEEAVVMLQDAVQSAGDDLKNRPFPEEIQRYKRAVKNFLRYVVEYGFAAERQIGIPQYLRPGYRGSPARPDARDRKTYTIVQVVDEKLERLAAGILTGQTGQLELLTRLEEINGILIDLLR